MGDLPLVSAIMPAHNAERYIGAALESVLAQDYEPFEVVVVDDGSTDRTREIACSFGEVRVVSQENRGRAGACNTAIRNSSGELVATFDADDLWPVNRLSLQVSYLLEHEEVGCVLGRQEWMNPPSWFGRDAVYGDLDGIPLVSAMFRRSVLDELGGFDETFRYSEDMDILVRLRERGIRMAVLPEVIYYRRFHEGQMTANPPEVLPILRSLRQKLERERAAQKRTQ
jgi:glycosyltransferase involved in cell wall biosynthesis